MDEYNNANAGGNDAGADNANANQDQGTQAVNDDANKNGQANGGDNANNANANNGEGGADDFKKKFGESTTENQRLMDAMKANGIDPKTGKPVASNNNQGADNRGANNDNLNNDAGDSSNFTDTELEKAIPGFAYLPESEKQTIRDAKNIAKTVTDLQRTVAELNDERVFNKELSTAIKDEGMKMLKEHEEEFRAFAYEEANLKVPFQHVANSFILKKTKEAGNNTGGDNNADGGNKPTGMEAGTGGGKELGKSVGDNLEVTGAEAKQLRKQDPRRYNDLARKGKLKIID